MEQTIFYYGYKNAYGQIEKAVSSRTYNTREEAEMAKKEAESTSQYNVSYEVFCTNRQKDEAFTAAMNKVWHDASETGNDNVQEYLFDYFSDDLFFICDEDMFIPAYRQNQSAMYGLLRGLMNYDWFWCKPDGSIDVENANHPDVAEALQPYVTKEMGLKALASF